MYPVSDYGDPITSAPTSIFGFLNDTNEHRDHGTGKKGCVHGVFVFGRKVRVAGCLSTKHLKTHTSGNKSQIT